MEGDRHVNRNSIIYRKGAIQRTEIERPFLAVNGFSANLVQFLNLYHRMMSLLVTCTSTLYVCSLRARSGGLPLSGFPIGGYNLGFPTRGANSNPMGNQFLISTL